MVFVSAWEATGMGNNSAPNRSTPGWARHGALSRALAKLRPTAGDPLLILSLPRSGSSWVGNVLAFSRDVLYLREPLTQRYLDPDESRDAVFYVTPENPPEEYANAARRVFIGLPEFGPSVLKGNSDWTLWTRRNKRVVIKEVNPYALPWLQTRYRFEPLLLLRHPAAIALSFKKLGWTANRSAVVFPPAIQARFPDVDWQSLGATLDFWQYQGLMQAVSTAIMLDSLSGMDYRLICYENLCADPVKIFMGLYEYFGLAWTAEIEARIIVDTTGGSDGTPYSLRRNSTGMATAWKQQISAPELSTMGETFRLIPTPYYQSADHWQL